jgi:hypothetical protein
MKKYIALFLTGTVFLYLLFAFVHSSISPDVWGIWARGFLAFAVVILAGITIDLYADDVL